MNKNNEVTTSKNNNNIKVIWSEVVETKTIAAKETEKNRKIYSFNFWYDINSKIDKVKKHSTD